MRYLVVVGLAAVISAGCWTQQEIVIGNDAGADIDGDSEVNFVDFALFDGCCIEVVGE